MGRKPLGKKRWQVTIPADVADAFDAVVPAGRNRNEVIESLIVAHLKKATARAKPKAK